MRIISKFQDYYDSALAFGFQNDRVLVRHTQAWNADGIGSPAHIPASAFLHKLQALAQQVTSFDAWGGKNFRETRPKNAHLQITPLVFCVGGRATKALWVVDVESTRLNYELSSWGRVRPLLPALDPADQYQTPRTFAEHPSDNIHQDGPVFDASEFERIMATWTQHYQQQRHNTRDAEHLERLQRWLAEPAPDLYLEAIAEKVSVAVAHAGGIAVNPRLKDWRFFKYWDAATCMQELSMFVGNMTYPDHAAEAMPDKYRVQSHGFDEQSFRKQPTKHGVPKRPKRPHPDTTVAQDTFEP